MNYAIVGTGNTTRYINMDLVFSVVDSRNEKVAPKVFVYSAGEGLERLDEPAASQFMGQFIRHIRRGQLQNE